MYVRLHRWPRPVAHGMRLRSRAPVVIWAVPACSADAPPPPQIRRPPLPHLRSRAPVVRGAVPAWSPCCGLGCAYTHMHMQVGAERQGRIVQRSRLTCGSAQAQQRRPQPAHRPSLPPSTLPTLRDQVVQVRVRKQKHPILLRTHKACPPFFFCSRTTASWRRDGAEDR